MARLVPKHYKNKDGKKLLSVYQAEFYDRHRHPSRKRVSLGTKDKRGAILKLAKLDTQYLAGLFDPWEDAVPKDGVLFSKAIEHYLKARSDRRPNTLRADRSVLQLFDESLGVGFMLQHVELRHVGAFLGQVFKESTLNTYYARLKGFFRWCVGEGLLKENPMQKMKTPKVGWTEAEYLTREQYEHLIRTIEADVVLKGRTLKEGEVIWLVDVVRFAVGTGLRLGELCNLRWSAVNLTTGFLAVKNANGFKTKSRHERPVYVTGEAREVLERLNQARASEADDYVFKGTSKQEGSKDKLNEEYVSKRLLYYARKAKLHDDIHFHSLRHTFASWLVMAGMDLYKVKELLGHASIETTMRYAHLAPKVFKDEMERIFG